MTYARWLLAGMAGAMAMGRADAGPLTIAPTTLEITNARQSAMLTVTNDSDQSVDLQFRAYTWSQPDDGEALLPTGDLVVSSAIVTVAPHQQQVFRVLRVRATQPGAEPSYRLRLNELPRLGVGGVAINLEFSIPVFVPAHGGASALSWVSDGRSVSIVNAGNRRVRLGALSLVGADGRRVAIPGSPSAYILAGSRRSFALAAGGTPPGGARLVGAADTGPIDVAGAAPPPR